MHTPFFHLVLLFMCAFFSIETRIIQSKGSITDKKNKHQCLELRVVNFCFPDSDNMLLARNELQAVEKGWLVDWSVGRLLDCSFY